MTPRRQNLATVHAFLASRPGGRPFPFQAFRDLRFPHGPECPHCLSSRVHRWGGFAGRRRYRCIACSHTFSDFTGTPLAYLKHIDRWPAFCSCIVDELPVRTCAEHLDVDVTTAFRWRHRLLWTLNVTDHATLKHQVSVGETCFAHSEKGKRNLDREPRRRAAVYWVGVRRAWVIVAQDVVGTTLASTSGHRRPGPADLVRTLVRRIRRVTCIVSGSGRHGAAARAAKRLGVHHKHAPGASRELTELRLYDARLRRWLGRFRGVATRYLDHYLAWHRSTESWAGPARFALLVRVSALAPGRPERCGAAGAWVGR